MVGWIVHSDVNKVLDLALKNCTLHLDSLILFPQRKPIAIAMAVLNMEYNPGAIAVHTSIGRFFLAIQSVTCKQSKLDMRMAWDEANEVMQQLNQSAPDAQSVHIVTMEVACQ